MDRRILFQVEGQEAFLALHALPSTLTELAAQVVDQVTQKSEWLDPLCRSDRVRTGGTSKDETERLDIRPTICIRGRETRQLRNVGFYADASVIEGYRYSGIIAKSKPLTKAMILLIDGIASVFGMEAAQVGILINEYEEGASIGAHSDDERDLVLGTTGVLAISMGASRSFRVKAKTKITMTDGRVYDPKDVVYDERTRQGTLLQMGGKDFQRLFTHQVPALARDKGIRWSLTFREYK